MLEYVGIWMDTSINPLILVGICWNTYYGLTISGKIYTSIDCSCDLKYP